MAANCHWEIPDEKAYGSDHRCATNVTCNTMDTRISCESHAPQCSWGPPNSDMDPPRLSPEVLSAPRCAAPPDTIIVDKCNVSRDDCTPEVSGCYWSEATEGCYTYHRCEDFATPEECAASKLVSCQWGTPVASPSPSPTIDDTNGHCEGSPDSCSGSSSSSCVKVKGCSWAGHRHPCSGGYGCFETRYSCEGSARDCEHMTSAANCRSQGCHWLATDVAPAPLAEGTTGTPAAADGVPTPALGPAGRGTSGVAASSRSFAWNTAIYMGTAFAMAAMALLSGA